MYLPNNLGVVIMLQFNFKIDLFDQKSIILDRLWYLPIVYLGTNFNISLLCHNLPLISITFGKFVKAVTILMSFCVSALQLYLPHLGR